MLIRQVIGLMTYNAEHHALVLDGTPETQRFTLVFFAQFLSYQLWQFLN